MSELVSIERLKAHPLTYRDLRCVTLKQIDQLHGRPDGTAGRNFRQHRDRMTEAKHYFAVPYAQWSQWVDETTNFVGSSETTGAGYKGDLILLTEKGYLLLVKSLNDDLAWEVQEALVDGYFRGGDPIEAVLVSALATRRAQLELESRQRALEHAQETLTLRQDETERLARAAMDQAENNFGYFTVLGFLRLCGRDTTCPEASRHGKRLTQLAAERGVEVRSIKDTRFGFVNVYPESLLREYFGVG